MGPLDELRAVYQEGESARTLEVDLGLHLANPTAYVHSTPDLFAMGRPVRMSADLDLILDPSLSFENPDCWWVWAAAGDLGAIAKLVPYWLPVIGFERGDVARFWDLEVFLRKVKARSIETYCCGGSYDGDFRKLFRS